jgi:hypothetical protein
MNERTDAPKDDQDRIGDLLDRGAGLAHRLGLRRMSRNLYSRSGKRHVERYNRGPRDAEENARTAPPTDEHIALHSVFAVEVFPPSASQALYDHLRRLPSGGIFRPRELAEQVVEQRRYPWSGAWWNLGTFYAKHHQGLVPGVGRMELPPQVDHLSIKLQMVVPSVACVVGQFVLSDETSRALEAILRTQHETQGVRNPDGSVTQRSPLFAKREDVAAVYQRLQAICMSWFASNLPGVFCRGLLDGSLPTCYFLTLDQAVPLSDQARLEYLDPLGVNHGHSALVSKELPGLRLSHPSGVDRRPHSFIIAGKREEVFAGTDLGGHDRDGFGFTVALDQGYTALWRHGLLSARSWATRWLSACFAIR